MGDFFLAPVFLLGALLAAIPVVIHLLYQRRAPQVLFSTIRFLQSCVRKTARRKRIENLLLLALRMLLFGLLALALAKPFFKSSLAGSSGPASTVIVLDNSYSMATRQQGEERFAAAKKAALDIVRAMSEKDSVAVILTGGEHSGEKPELTHRLNDVRSSLLQAEVFAGHADLVTAINRAFEAMEPSRDVNRDIIVMTDLQANSFDGDLAAAALAHKDVPIFFYDCGQDAVVNLAVTDVALKGGGRLPGSLQTIQARVYNPTESEVRDARVTLYVDGHDVKTELVTVKPRAKAVVPFTWPADESRTVTGWVQLSEDSLDVDNRYNFRIGAADRINVLVLRDEQADVSYLDEGYFLVRALAPSGGDNQVGSPIRPQLRLTSELARITPGDFAAVFLLNVRSLDPAAVGKLRSYVERGGMLAFFTGDRMDPERWSTVFRPDGTGLFPARLAPAAGDAEKRRDFWHMGKPDFEWSGLARLKDVSPELFERVRAYRFFPIDGYDPAKVQVLAPLVSDKATPSPSPLVASARLGEGQVFFFAVPATTGWTNFPATKVFVPMLHEMIYAVTGKSGRLESVVAGQPKRFDFGDVQGEVAVAVEVRQGQVEVRKSTHDASGNQVVFDDTWRPGIYAYTLSGAKQGRDWFVVNPDTRESDLARIGEPALREKFGSMRLVLARTPEELASERLALREGHPLSGYVFLLIVGIAAFELFLANRTRPAQVEEPMARPGGAP